MKTTMRQTHTLSDGRSFWIEIPPVNDRLSFGFADGTTLSAASGDALAVGLALKHAAEMVERRKTAQTWRESVSNPSSALVLLVDDNAMTMLSFLMDNLNRVPTVEGIDEETLEDACDFLFPGTLLGMSLDVPHPYRAAAVHLLQDFAKRADETAVEYKALLADGHNAPCPPSACLRAASACRVVSSHLASAK